MVNLDWQITEKELQHICSKYGAVEKTRIPTDVSGKSKGFGFVAFSSKDEAEKALDLDKTKIGSRIVTVNAASKTHVKRQATAIIGDMSRSSHSPSPDVQMTNGTDRNAASPSPYADKEDKPLPSEIKARTVALLNLPDTVNDARVTSLAESYGPLVKVVLRPDHQGAIIEFKDVADAGRASLGLNGHEIIPGRKIGIGDVTELLKLKDEKRTDRIGSGVGSKKEAASQDLQSGLPIRRPHQATRGRRGGLGFKREGTDRVGQGDGKDRASVEKSDNGQALKEKDEDGRDQKSEEKEGRQKSNADFKALFAGKK